MMTVKSETNMKDKTVTMETVEYDRNGLIVPSRNNMVLKFSHFPFKRLHKKTSVEIEMPAGSSSETVGTQSSYNPLGSHVGQHGRNKTGNTKYGGTDAWWSAGDFLQPEIASPQSEVSSFGKTNDDDTWDLSDSIVDLYKESNRYDGVLNQPPSGRTGNVDVQEWIQEDTSNGFVHVFKSDTDRNPRLFPCTLTTTAQRLCIQCGMPPNSLHVQMNGDIIRRLEPFDSPLAIQNEYLQSIGYSDQRKIQEIGAQEDLCYLVKYYAGKPVSDSTYSRNQLTSFAYVRKGKLLHQWSRRLCVISGTRLLIYRDKSKSGKPTVVQLAKGSVEEVKNIKAHDHVLKLTSTLQGERSVYLSFSEDKEYNKWIRKCKKATAKLPTKADLSNCHLEFLPETVFINDGLEILNLRHNVLKERPIEEDIYTIGWLDDLPRLTNLRSLNLADNNLSCFPLAVCRLRMLTELNLASNKIEDVPPTIVDLENLQILHLHNNQLAYLPEEMSRMRNLLVLVLAFNHFTSIPAVLQQSTESLLRIDSLIMAGNRIEKLPHDVLSKIHHIKKIDFRMNRLTLTPSEMAKFHLLELVTHLDVRDNAITELDVRPLRNLEYLNCERNNIHNLQVSGCAIKTVFAMKNELTSFNISPKPEWLVTLDLSYNRLESIPVWISDCFFLVNCNASHNAIRSLPDRLLCGSPKLRVLSLSHNQLTSLPSEVGNSVLEEISVEHNHLDHLPESLFVNLPKLRFICLTNNRLETIPEPNQTGYQNKLQELYLSANRLDDSVVPRITLFQKLKILHLAYNQITEIHDRDLRKLENLQELNISGNYLRHLPRCVGRHSKLQALRSNANLIKELPDFRYSPNLKVLEVGSNRLMDVSVTNLMASNVNLLDISGNPEMQVNSAELRGIKSKKKVCMVDIKGQNRSLLDLRTAGLDDLDIPWQSGLSQTSGMRNKLSVSIVNRPKFNEGKEGFFALFDGGRNDEVIRLLANQITGLMEVESQHPITAHDYLKYTILSAHRKLKLTGQKIGAAAAVCHIQRPSSDRGHYTLNIANVGDIEVVLCRRGEAMVMSKLFTVDSNKKEMERIAKSGGIVTEDNKINGVTQNTRLLGSSYLFPFVVPEPHITKTTLQPDDQLLIIANQGLWKCMSYQETVDEIIDIPDPVLAAKKLQDLAQGYRSQENIGVLVVRFMLSPAEKGKMREMLQTQFENEQQLLAELRVRDIEREEMRKRAELEEMTEMVPMEIVKLKGAKKRKQVGMMFNGVESGFHDTDEIDRMIVQPLPNDINGDPTTNWELLLQKRLTEEVKDKELIHAMRVNDYDPYFPSLESDENWSTTTKLKGQVKERTVTLPPPDDHGRFVNGPPPPTHLQRRQIIPEEAQISTESLEFRRELKHPLNVDRDAILFHNMQLDRHKNMNMSSRSIDSIQSDPSHVSNKQMLSKEKKSSSHSIEVLLHGPTAEHTRQISFGGSHKFQKDGVVNAEKDTDSCPTDMNEKFRLQEQKGFIQRESEKSDGKGKRKIEMEEAEKGTDTIRKGIVNADDDDNSGMDNLTDDFDHLDIDYETKGPADVSRQITSKESIAKNRGDMEIMITGENFSANNMNKLDFNKNVSLEEFSEKRLRSSTGDISERMANPNSEEVTELYATVKKTSEQKKHAKENNNQKDEHVHATEHADHNYSLSGRASPPLHHWADNKNLSRRSGERVKVNVGHSPSLTPKTIPNKDQSHSNMTRESVTTSEQQNATRENEIIPKPHTVEKTVIKTHGATHYSDKSVIGHKGAELIQRTGHSTTAVLKDKPTVHEGHRRAPAPPIPPRVPLKSTINGQNGHNGHTQTALQSDINSNSIKSLDDLIAYNRMQQKMSYKVTPKAAPTPPQKVPETTIVTKTASQRSIVITYL
ncbi:PH domain leucine-rich repeat-containing protein phosphatase 2-like isoform X2 [Mya arenaria]|uniref:PH domain leucine-rich repeat-containing protein phosphatase 2-like isoform X2 n=1 Tax=Mya arenaria TaxID=6604 RepID=UPI0022E79C80|nr:PH domain leucine-rich repeat-containing protein phosphatase 2-like isoform X2 [Mya arenaria]